MKSFLFSAAVPVQLRSIWFVVDCFGSQSFSVALYYFVVDFDFVAAFRSENPVWLRDNYFSDSYRLEPEPEVPDCYVYWPVNEKLKNSQGFD